MYMSTDKVKVKIVKRETPLNDRQLMAERILQDHRRKYCPGQKHEMVCVDTTKYEVTKMQMKCSRCPCAYETHEDNKERKDCIDTGFWW
jgi:hypothetical protein